MEGHLRDLMFDKCDVIKASFDKLPESLKTLFYFRAYEVVRDDLLPLSEECRLPNDPSLGEKAYFRDESIP